MGYVNIRKKRVCLLKGTLKTLSAILFIASNILPLQLTYLSTTTASPYLLCQGRSSGGKTSVSVRKPLHSAALPQITLSVLEERNGVYLKGFQVSLFT